MAASHPTSRDARTGPAIAGGTALIAVFIVAVLGVTSTRDEPIEREQPRQARAQLPDFGAIPSVTDRKTRFFAFLRPVVEAENARLRQQRERVLRLRNRLSAGAQLAETDRAWLDEMAQRYRVDADAPLAQARLLSRRVDVIPASLALAQAALESAWGTSRFARKANNLFGLWCNTPGCGLVPKERPEGQSYEVEAFDDVGAAFRSYMNDLNAHPAYKPLRDIRARLRNAGQPITGRALAAGLIHYAAIGEQYVEHIRGVIRRNDLDSGA
jgi:Bax protein